MAISDCCVRNSKQLRRLGGPRHLRDDKIPRINSPKPSRKNIRAQPSSARSYTYQKSNFPGQNRMHIFDYESASQRNDVKIVLTRQEAEELAIYLNAMLDRPSLTAFHLTEVESCSFEKDIRFEIANEVNSA